MASVDGGLPERIKLAASCAGAGRQALNTLRLLHYDVTAGSVTVLAIAYQLPAAAPAHALQEALGGTVAQLAAGLLLGAHERGDGELLQVTLYCARCSQKVLGAVLARRTTDRTMAAWRQLRARAPDLQQDHLIPESPRQAPWGFSEMPGDVLPSHACLAARLQDAVRTLARA